MSLATAEQTSESAGPVRRGLLYFDIDAALSDIAALRRGYKQSGNWSLEQIAWHLCQIMTRFQTPAAPDATQTPEQAAKLKGFYDIISQPGGASKFPASAAVTPGPDCSENDVDRLVAAFTLFRDFSAPKIDLGPFGATDIEMARRLHLTHASHHLSFLSPIDHRETLSYTNEDDAIADVQNLRRGHRPLGAWTLEQAAWHLNAAIRVRIKDGPFEVDRPEQIALRPALLNTIATRRLPVGIKAPPFAVPPNDAPASAIDDYIDSLNQMKNRTVPLAPHRLFGNMSVEEGRTMTLLHCMHHMKRFVPTA